MANVLATVVFLGGLASALLGLAIFGEAKSAVHEIEGLICFLIAVCGLGLAGVVFSLGRQQTIETELRALHKLAAEAGQREMLAIAQQQHQAAHAPRIGA